MNKRTVFSQVSLPQLALKQPALGNATAGALLSVGGDSCLNLRERRPGTLESVAHSAQVASTLRRPVFSDTRLGVLHIFTLDEEGMLRLDMTRSSDGVVTNPGAELGHIAPGDCKAVRAGDFLVISDSQCKLHYLLWDRTTAGYRRLGDFPDAPAVSVSATPLRTFSAEVPAVTFGQPIADLRGGADDALSRQLCLAVSQSAADALKTAADTGCWCSPVSVRIGIRMWDGTLLHLSDPVGVAPCGFVQTRRVQLPVLQTSAGFEGTKASTLSISGFKINLNVDTAALEEWSAIAPALEVWVSKSPAAEVTAEGKVTYSQSSGVHTLNVHPACPADEELMRSLLTGGYCKVASLSTSTDNGIVELSRHVSERETENPGSLPLALSVSTASAIEGHGGFLHLAGYTLRRPLPGLPQGEAGATQTAQCSVTVLRRDLGGAIRTDNAGTVCADDGRILPWIWYPDATATSVTVNLTYPDGRLYSRTFALQPLPGEDAACYIAPSARAVELDRVAALPTHRADTAEDVHNGTIMTMKRGNPFVAQCVTSHAAGDIFHIKAQQSGGGAYTRQYLYLFSDTGIVALTHDMEGYHRNCRPVSRRTVRDRRRIAAGDNCIWALCDRGALIRLTDSRIGIVMRGLNAGSAIGYFNNTGEIWAVPADGETAGLSVVIASGDDDDVRGYLSDFVPSGMLDCGDTTLTVERQAAPARGWNIGELPALPDGHTVSEWLSPVIELDCGGLAQALVSLSGDSVDADIEVRGLPPQEYSMLSGKAAPKGELLVRRHIAGHTGHIVAIPLILPEPKHFAGMKSNRLRISVKGVFHELDGFGFEILN